MWPFGKRIESVFRVSYFFEAKVLIINYENLVRGKVEFLQRKAYYIEFIHPYSNFYSLVSIKL